MTLNFTCTLAMFCGSMSKSYFHALQIQVMNKLNQIWLLFFAIIVTGCTLKEPEFEAQVLVPVYKTSLNPENLTGVLPIQYTDTFPSSSLPYNPFAPIPADTNLTIGPLLLADTFNTYLGITGTNVRIKLTLLNNLPLDFESNARLILVNAGRQDSVVDTRINVPIPGRGSRLVFVTNPISVAFFNDDVRLILSELRTSGTTGIPNYTLYNRLIIDVEIIPERITEYYVSTLKDYVLQDTTDFSFSENKEFMRAKTAELNFFFDNDFPSTLNYQAFFLDENKVVIDSVLTGRDLLTGGSELDTLGFTIPGTSKNVKATNFLSEARLIAIRKTKFLASEAAFRTDFISGGSNSTIILRPSNRVTLTVTTKSNIQISNNP